MAEAGAINSDMARILLRKVKGKDSTSPEKSKNTNSFDDIKDQLNTIEKSLDPKSKVAEERKKSLIDSLFKAFDEEGMSLKEQKKILEDIDEKVTECFYGIVSLKIDNINRFFSIMSDPKLLGEVINKGIDKSSMTSKALEVARNTIEKMKDGLSTVVNWANKSALFISDMISGVKEFVQNSFLKIKDYIATKFNNLVNGMFTYIINPVRDGFRKIFSTLTSMWSSIKSNFEQMRENFGLWIIGTVIPLLFSIVTFIAFTIIPAIVSLVIAIPAMVATILAAIFPILLIAAGLLILAVIFGYLLYKAYSNLDKIFSYIFSMKFVEDVKGVFLWIWDNVILPVWNGLMWAWDEIAVPLFEWLDKNLPIFWSEVLKPALNWIWDTLRLFWNGVAVPLFEWLWKNLPGFWENTLKPAILFMWDVLKKIKDVFVEVWNQILVPLFERLLADFLKGWPILMGWVEKIFNFLMNDVVDTVTEYDPFGTGAWFKSFFEEEEFAVGGIVTKPTNAIIGEAGVSEAVIPLDKKGMMFIRDSFQIDEMAIQQIVKSSDLYRNQNKMLIILEGMSKTVEKIRYSLSEVKNKNQIRNPQEILIAGIKTDKIEEVSNTNKIFDIDEIEKLIQNSDGNVINKLEELINLIKSTDNKKESSLLNPGSSTVDSYQQLLKAISTGIIGTRS